MPQWFHQLFQILFLTVGVINALVGWASWKMWKRSQARKHALITLGCFAMFALAWFAGEPSSDGPAPDASPPTASTTLPARPHAPTSAPATVSAPPATTASAPSTSSAPATTSAPTSAPATGVGPSARRIPGKQAGRHILDALWYLLASMSPVLVLVGGVFFFFIRKKAVRSGNRPKEKLFYVVLMIGGGAILLWSTLRPDPTIFEDHAGLHWGIRMEQASWTIHNAEVLPDDAVLDGLASLRIEFGALPGWIVFHHFPTGPSAGRYNGLEFAYRMSDLPQGVLRVCLIGKDQTRYPEGGLVVPVEQVETVSGKKWARVWVKWSDFGFEEKRILGIGFGRAKADQPGTLYLDQIRLTKD